MIVSEKKVTMSSSRAVVAFFKSIILKMDEFDQFKEHFWMTTVNARNVSQKTHLISLGCMTSSMVHPREAFRPAVMDSAAAVLFIHNHPSGDPTPSDEDMKLTGRLEQAGSLLGIKVLDHIVIAQGGFVSIMDGTQRGAL